MDAELFRTDVDLDTSNPITITAFTRKTTPGKVSAPLPGAFVGIDASRAQVTVDEYPRRRAELIASLDEAARKVGWDGSGDIDTSIGRQAAEDALLRKVAAGRITYTTSSLCSTFTDEATDERIGDLIGALLRQRLVRTEEIVPWKSGKVVLTDAGTARLGDGEKAAE